MKVLLECPNCGQEFMKEKGQVNRNLKLGHRNFCSKKCATQFAITSKFVPCDCCGKLLKRTQSELYRNKQNFCSQSCAAKINNKARKQIKLCVSCGKPLKRNGAKFCSNACQFDKQYIDFVSDWKSGKNDGTTSSDMKVLSGYIRRYLFEKYESKCSICGWSEVNPYTGRIPLEVHHIDGDADNNSEDNLSLVCPNCHSLTESYRGANRGNGRNVIWRPYPKSTPKKGFIGTKNNLEEKC